MARIEAEMAGFDWKKTNLIHFTAYLFLNEHPAFSSNDHKEDLSAAMSP
jgi:hypothetical protein